MEELVASIEQRDAADPDAPPWEAVARIRALEQEIARRLEDERPVAAVAQFPSERTLDACPETGVAGSVA